MMIIPIHWGRIIKNSYHSLGLYYYLQVRPIYYKTRIALWGHIITKLVLVFEAVFLLTGEAVFCSDTASVQLEEGGNPLLLIPLTQILKIVTLSQLS